MDIRTFARIASDQAYRTPGFNSWLGLNQTISAYATFHPEGFDLVNLPTIIQNAAESCLLNSNLSNTSLDVLISLCNRVSGLNTYAKKLQWYNDFKAANLFPKGNAILCWVLWNYINGTLDAPTTAPDAPLLSL